METKNQMKMNKTALLVFVFALQGCVASQPDLYHWGRYEDLMYEKYSNPGKYSPEEHIAKLEADYEVAKSKDKALPPGYHAQLGVLYYQIGKPEQALGSFTAESEIFPESKRFMDRLIDTVKKGRGL